MASFELILENKKRGSYNNLARFIILLNIAVFAILAFYTTARWIFWIAIVMAIVLTLLFMFRNNTTRDLSNIALLAAAISWTVLLYWWPAAVSIVLWLFYMIAKRPLLVSFSEAAIVYPSFPKRNVAWNELDNTILKDDLLTIDFKNNKILQQMIEKTAKSVNEKEFNDFCRIQLQNAKPRTINS